MPGELNNVDFGNLNSEQLDQLFKDLETDDIINGPMKGE